MKNEAVIQVTCSECGRKEVRYSAVQLRSADEGSTIFYTCDCGHKYVVVECALRPIANIVKVEYKQLSPYEFDT
jgi:lysyl-tRNA synthetase class I